jgi:hypothetical protein
MDRSGVEKAAKLLAKAQSTGWNGEGIAFVEKAYQLLAGVINAADHEMGLDPGSPRRRERRLRRERRAGRHTINMAAPPLGTDLSGAYGRLVEGLRPRSTGSIDLTG